MLLVSLLNIISVDPWLPRVPTKSLFGIVSPAAGGGNRFRLRSSPLPLRDPTWQPRQRGPPSPFTCQPRPCCSLKGLFLLRRRSKQIGFSSRRWPVPGKKTNIVIMVITSIWNGGDKRRRGPLKQTPPRRRIAALFLFMKAAVMHISAN